MHAFLVNFTYTLAHYKNGPLHVQEGSSKWGCENWPFVNDKEVISLNDFTNGKKSPKVKLSFNALNTTMNHLFWPWQWIHLLINILQMTLFTTNHKEFSLQLKSWHACFNFHQSYAFLAWIIKLIDVITRGSWDYLYTT